MIEAAVAEPLEAQELPEIHEAGRADVALLVASRADGGVAHARFADLGRFLRPGDLLVVNTSATLPAALPAQLDGEDVLLHLSTPAEAGNWVVEVRTAELMPLPAPRMGAVVGLPGGASAKLLARYLAQQAPVRGPALARRAGRELPAPPREADPLSPRAERTAARRLPDRLRGRSRQRGDAERGPPVHGRARRGAGCTRSAHRAGDAARRRVVARARREPVPRALPRAGRDRAARERRARLGRPGDRRGHHRRARARDGCHPRGARAGR